MGKSKMEFSVTNTKHMARAALPMALQSAASGPAEEVGKVARTAQPSQAYIPHCASRLRLDQKQMGTCQGSEPWPGIFHGLKWKNDGQKDS